MLAHDAVRRIYELADRDFERGLSTLDGVSCRQGCAGCCHQLVFCGYAEAHYIVQEMMAWWDWREWVRRLFSAAREMFTDGLSTATWFRRAIPCVFLTRDRTCSIYGRRPPVCRYYVVTSPPENCMPGAKDDQIRRLDADGLAQPLMTLNIDLMAEHPELGTPLFGPLPAMVLLAWRSVDGTGSPRRYVEKRLSRLPPVSTWMRCVVDVAVARGLLDDNHT